MINHIFSNLTEEYENIVEDLKDELNEGIDMLTINSIWDNLSAKYNIINARSNKNEGK